MVEIFYAKNAETALMGAAFAEPSLFLGTADPRDFGTPGYSKLWAFCQELVSQGIVPNEVTVPENVIPGGWNISQFIDYCPSPYLAGQWLPIIRQWTRRRELREAAQVLLQAAHSDDDEARKGLLDLHHAHLEAYTEPEEKRIFSIADLLEDETPLPPDLVEGFIPGQTTVLLSGRGGDCKSYAMLDLAIAVASGEPWLGLEVSQTPVLYFDLENRRTWVTMRVKEVLRGHGLLDDWPPLRFVFKVDKHLDHDDAILEYAQLIERAGARLAIFDSVVDFLGDTDENSNPEMGQVAERMRKLVDYTGASLAGIHHTPKSGNGPRGATALRNGIDVNVMISREGNVLRLHQDKNRVGPEQTILCRLNWGPGLFNLSPIGVTIGRKRTAPDPDEAAILEVLDDGAWHTSSDVANIVMEQTQHTRQTIHRKLRDMVGDGLLEASERMKGKSYQVRRNPYEDTLPG